MQIDKMKLDILLAKRGWRYADLARKMGFTRQGVSWYIVRSKENKITQRALDKFSTALDVEPQLILKEEEK